MKQFEYQIQSYPMDRKTSLSTMQDELNALRRSLHMSAIRRF